MPETKTYRFYTKTALKIFFLLFIFHVLLFTIEVNAQSITWQRILPDYYGIINKAQQTIDGGFIAVGSVYVNNISKIRLVKFNFFGDTLWAKIIGVGNTHGYWVEETSEKGFIIGGDIDSGLGNKKAYIVKTDSLGNIIWHKTFSNSENDACICVKKTPDGGYILSCITWPQMLDRKILLIKTDSNGNLLWQKIYGDGLISFVGQEIQVLNNCFILTGFKEVGISSSDILLMKFNLNGDTLWTNTYGGSNIDYGKSIIAPPLSNSYIIAGYTRSFSPNSRPETYIIKTDTNGLLQWQRTYSYLGEDISNSIRHKPNNGYVLAGISDSLNNQVYKAKIRLIDYSGNVLFEKSYNPEANGDSDFKNVELTDDGGFIVGGYSSTSNSESMYIVKTDSMGFANPISIKNNQSNIPIFCKLYQNYPNPFNPVTTIQFDVPPLEGVGLPGLDGGRNISLKIYDIIGKEVVILVNEKLSAGSYKVMFDGTNFASGIYLYQLSVGDYVKTMKMVLLK